MRFISAALMLLALGTPAFAEDQCKPVDYVVKLMTESTGEDYKASRPLDAKQFAAALSITKSHTKTPEAVTGDGALFIASDDTIFIAFTTEGKVCIATVIPVNIANAIVAGDPSAVPPMPANPPAGDPSDTPSAPLRPTPEHHFEHHDSTES